MTVFKLYHTRTQKGNRLVKSDRELTPNERARYGKSKQLRYVAGSDEPIYPIGYIQHKHPMAKKQAINLYTPEGRAAIHDNLQISNLGLLWKMKRQPQRQRSAEFADNRLSLFTARYGKCAITGQPFESLEKIHCHHKTPRAKGGNDKYQNLILINDKVHKLIHAVKSEIIQNYLNLLKLDDDEIAKINKLRLLVGNKAI